jgi:isopentenyl-diphosphate delta-isomerase type 1
MYNPNTTDNQEEVYDVVDESDEVIGTATRRQVHADPRLIHRAAGAYIFNQKKQLLMQKRSQTKDMFPGFWAFSVGGHVDSGDTYEEAVRREIREELGTEIKVVPLEKVLQREPEETEFWQVFMGIHDGPFPSFNTTEADEVKFFDIDTLLTAVSDESIPMPPNVIKLLPSVKTLVQSGKIDELIKESTYYV